MEISVLGPLAVVEDGVPVTIRRARCRALLAFLVSRHPERVAAEVLAEALWPDAPDGDRALNSARVHVHHLRRSLPGHDAVLPSGDRGYGLAIPPDALDVARFADHAARAASSRAPAKRRRRWSTTSGRSPNGAARPTPTSPLSTCSDPCARSWPRNASM